jgi:pyridoxal phosphate-dependent aminotransferase EpsN
MPPVFQTRASPHFDIFLSPPELGGAEGDALASALASNWVAPAGPMLRKFEQRVADHCGVSHAVAVSSGTAALHLALRAAGVEAGDEVLCATFSFVASANPILYLGARPVFIDSEERTWNIDPALIEEALIDRAAKGKLPKAMIVTDIYGQCVDADPLRAIADAFNVVIVEDAAEALGALYRDRQAGSLGDIAALSFNGNKIITTSGGGMVISNHAKWVDQAHFWATQAREPGLAYTHLELGYNYRLSNLLAALGYAQMDYLAARVAARRRIFERYQAGLADLPGVSFMPEPEGFVSTRWLTCLTIDRPAPEGAAERICAKLHEAGIEARPLWRPLHEQPVYGGAPCYGGAVSQRLARRGLSLPSGSGLTAGDQERVIEVFRRHFPV